MSETFIHSRRILFGDCDPGGILYTPRASHFIVEAGLAFFREKLGSSPERKMFEMGIAPPARAMSIEFLKPMTWDDELDVHVSVSEIRTHAIRLAFSGRVADQATFVAELTMVCVSTKSMKPTPVPESLRRALLGDEEG